MDALFPFLRRVLLLLVLAVSLTATAFAHRPPALQDTALALALANGASLADFCAGDLDGDGHPDPHCLACQIVAGGLLPDTVLAVVDLDLAFHAQVIAPQERRARARAIDPAHRPQGPPVA